MKYIFTSPAAASVLMLSPYGTQLLGCMGKMDSEQGIITPEQLPAAIAALESLQRSTTRTDEDQLADLGTGIEKRVLPLLTLLRAAQSKNKPVTWERSGSA